MFIKIRRIILVVILLFFTRWQLEKNSCAHSRFCFDFFENSSHFVCSNCLNFLDAFVSFKRVKSRDRIPCLLRFTSSATPADLCPVRMESRPVSCELTCVSWLSDCVFICDNGKCLLDDKEKCDGVDNCGDYSDELKPCSEYIVFWFFTGDFVQINFTVHNKTFSITHSMNTGKSGQLGKHGFGSFHNLMWTYCPN